MTTDDTERRCRTCARFVRVIESVDSMGEVRRAGECLLGVWPSPLYETNTCSQWVKRGEFRARPAAPDPKRRSSPRRPTAAQAGVFLRRDPITPAARAQPTTRTDLNLPEDLLEMDAEDFKRVLAEVLREELGLGDAELAGKWEGGEMVLKAGKEGLQDKRVPIEALFRKIVMIRDKLRVLEQRINSHPKLGDDDKLQLQQYVTGCYGSLTTFNVLFASRDDQFVGQKGDE
jgi:hypothetical protein